MLKAQTPKAQQGSPRLPGDEAPVSPLRGLRLGSVRHALSGAPMKRPDDVNASGCDGIEHVYLQYFVVKIATVDISEMLLVTQYDFV